LKQEKITRFVKTEDADRKWYVVDATDQVLGRLAAKVASVIRGKNKPSFTPNMDTGDFVIVVNADKIKMTGKRELQKTYFRHTGYPGGGRELSYQQIGKKLKVYVGSDHPHTAQKPEPLSL
jgi:large subunit ribosomal protein L13